jgi:predicted nucleic acid-binding protein
MIVLDTNVLSELVRSTPSPEVLSCLKRFPAADRFTTVITEAEMQFGVAILPAGRRRRILQTQLDEIFKQHFDGRILVFDSEAAQAFAKLASERRAKGRPISYFDAQIAAIVQINGATLLTGNSRDFEGCGIVVVNPWLNQP